jgi:hydroxymethylbilane synthase
MSSKVIIIGARKSQLSLTQTNHVIDVLKCSFPDHEFQLKTISTAGDRSMDHAALFNHQGIFVKELEEALLRREIDLAVHSLKDMPCDIKEGLALGAVSLREDARDAFLTTSSVKFSDLKPGSRIGTSSVRRRAQILHARPDLKIAEMRGNVDTRLRKLGAGDVDALVIASAGIVRLGLEKLITERMPFDIMLPAPCQGALALEIREGDRLTMPAVALFDHAPTRAAITAERAFLKGLGGGCSLPVGAFAEVENGILELTGQVLDPEGKKKVQRVVKGPAAAAAELGCLMAIELLNSHGDWIKIALQSPDPKRSENII